MSEDPRCCGTGTCIIDPEGRCWCGQQWDGEKMAMPKLELSANVINELQELQAPRSKPNQPSAAAK